MFYELVSCEIYLSPLMTHRVQPGLVVGFTEEAITKPHTHTHTCVSVCTVQYVQCVCVCVRTVQ